MSRRDLLLLTTGRSSGDAFAELLRSGGFDVTVFDSVADTQAAIAGTMPALVLLDRLPHDRDAASICAAWRQQPSTGRIPIIVLGQEGDDDDQMRCLDQGSDDWVAREHAERLLVVRVKALLRRSDPLSFRGLLRLGSLALDDAARRLTVLCEGRRHEANLSPMECRLLRYLMANPQTPLTRSDLLLNVWGVSEGIDARTVDVHINRLREVLSRVGCKDRVETVRGVGYRLLAYTGGAFV